MYEKILWVEILEGVATSIITYEVKKGKNHIKIETILFWLIKKIDTIFNLVKAKYNIVPQIFD